MAQFVSPAALSLNEKGVLGVKTVNGQNNKVEFHAAQRLSDLTSKVFGSQDWTTMPASSRSAQGFVRVGDVVRVATRTGRV